MILEYSSIEAGPVLIYMFFEGIVSFCLSFLTSRQDENEIVRSDDPYAIAEADPSKCSLRSALPRRGVDAQLQVRPLQTRSAKHVMHDFADFAEPAME